MKRIRSRIVTSIQSPLLRLLEPLSARDEAFHLRTAGSMRDIRAQHQRLNERIEELAGSVLHSRWLAYPGSLFSRNEVGYWLNWLGLFGEGVEVGVYKGDFSRELLERWQCASLTSVDAWREFPSSSYVDSCNVSQEQHDRNFAETCAKLERFGSRSRILRKTSEEASQAFAAGSLDFVYLDAMHHYDAVKLDLELWHPKVKAGGVLGGHDYFDGTIESGVYGVKRAVDEFAGSRGYDVIVTRESFWQSWFIRVN